MRPNSFQWCPETGQGAMGTNWGTGSSVWTWGGTSSLWEWRSTGTGCPGRLWSLLLWRYSRPAWTRSCAACCRWPCFSRRVGLDDPQWSLPTPTILWFCDSVILQWLCPRRQRYSEPQIKGLSCRYPSAKACVLFCPYQLEDVGMQLGAASIHLYVWTPADSRQSVWSHLSSKVKGLNFPEQSLQPCLCSWWGLERQGW